MDFAYPPAAERFRAEVRTWLDEHLTERYRGLDSVIGAAVEELERLREWNRLLADAGLAAIAWPQEYGGRGAGLVDEMVLAEEMSRANAPPTLNPIGLSNIAPAIMQYGTEEQRRRFLPRMLRGDDIWCQGFSEPDAGSDLAALTTSAVRDGDHYVVNGQKMWNTLGDVADWCEFLVRTDSHAPKHKGISCLLVDMTLPGIEVRPLRTATGERQFNEIVLTDVRVPAAALLGPENEGWRVAITTLAHERAGVANLHLGVRRKLEAVFDLARATPMPDGRPASDDPRLRQRLARLYVEVELLRLLSQRAVSAALHGRVTGAESSIAKLHWSELEQRVTEVAADVLGPAATAGPWARDRIYARSHTIAGGTTQVNKNVIAQRLLGLPRNP